MHLYIHIPFCVKKCLYCDFLSVPSDGEKVSLYLDALIKDIEAGSRSLGHAPSGDASKHSLSTVYIGGGTPGLLTPTQINLLMDTINANYILEENAEITIEVNPCTVTNEKLVAYKNAGINRISMGVQSFNNETLKTLGRAHDAETAIKAFAMIRHTGFKNVNLDLISCVPGEIYDIPDRSLEVPRDFIDYSGKEAFLTTEEGIIRISDVKCFKDSLEIIKRLNPEHISVYQLIIEEGTPFYDKYGPGSGYEPDEDEQASVYQKTAAFLAEAGYSHYEISNFAKTGYESRHNCAYWRQHDYIGCGAGASGMIYERDEDGHITGAIRYRKQADISSYIKSFSTLNNNALDNIDYNNDYNNNVYNNNDLYSEVEYLTGSELKSEHYMLAMRMRPGFIPEEYIKNYGEAPDECRMQILKKYSPDYVTIENGVYSFTEKGFLVSNTILSEII